MRGDNMALDPNTRKQVMLNLSSVALTNAIKAGADPFFLGVAAALHPLAIGGPVFPDFNCVDFENGYLVGKMPGPVHAPSLSSAIQIWALVSQ